MYFFFIIYLTYYLCLFPTLSRNSILHFFFFSYYSILFLLLFYSFSNLYVEISSLSYKSPPIIDGGQPTQSKALIQSLFLFTCSLIKLHKMLESHSQCIIEASWHCSPAPISSKCRWYIHSTL